MDDLYCPQADGKLVQATDTGATVSITDLDASGRSDDVLWVFNRGANMVRIRFGAAATGLSFPVPAGDMQPFRCGAHTVVGLWCETGTEPVELHRGDGV